MMKTILLLLTLSCFPLLIACANPEDEVFEVVTKLASIVGPGGTQEDHDYYLEHITDNFNSVWGYPTVADCAADIDECIDDSPLDPPKRDTLIVDGDKATITVTKPEQTPTGDSFRLVFDLTVVKQDGLWKGDTITAGDDKVPSGVELVPLELNFNLIELVGAISICFPVTDDIFIVPLEPIFKVGEAPPLIFIKPPL